MAGLWNHEKPVTEYVPEMYVPAWISDDISPSDIAAILQGGCASGAYMPAVTYHQALKTMTDHGDDILQYIEDAVGELPDVKGQGWAQMACTYVSAAVELWASSIEDDLTSQLEDLETESDEQEA